MARPRLLEPEEVARALDALPGWSGGTDALRRTYGFPGFPELIAAVDELAEVAEEMDHHPDLDIRWRTLHVVLSTHDQGGVTQLDVEQAHRAEEIARRGGAR